MSCFAVAKVENWGVDKEEENVGVLTKDNFDDFIGKNPKVFVKFYAPWCGHCKAMAPAYASLAKRMKEEENSVPIMKVDATVEKELAEKYGVQGFPTLKFFIDGEPVDYQGAREENDIYNWIQKKTGPASSLITSDEELEKHGALNLSVLMLLPEGEEEALKRFMNVAMNYDDVAFAHSHSEDHKSSLGVTEKFGFVVFRDFDDGKKFLVDNNVPTVESMKNFFEAIRFPIVMSFD